MGEDCKIFLQNFFLHPTNKAEALNKHVTKLYHIYKEPEPSQTGLNIQSESYMPPLSVTEEVGDQLHNINSKNTSGPDGICPKILNETRGSISSPLTKLLNMCLKSRKCPR